MNNRIIIPQEIDLEQSIQFSSDLKQSTPCEHCVFDFGQVYKVRPFGMLRMACAIREYINKYKFRTTFEMTHRLDVEWNRRAVGYAAVVGFFDECGLSHGSFRRGRGGENYVPIRFRNTSDLITNRGQHGPEIETIAAQLANQLLRESSSPSFDAVAFSFCEIIRNVVEHSRAESIGYCAQFWPSKDLVEIAIADNGVGLQSTLSNNPNLNIKSDGDALKFALAPGVSGKRFQGVRTDFANDFQNSGYGLYMNYRVCNEGGDFFICSGQAGMFRRKDAGTEYLATDFRGTIIRLRLKTTELEQYPQLIKRFNHDGALLAKQSKNGAILTASRMSALLRNNFKGLRDGIIEGVQVVHLDYGIGYVVDMTPYKPETLALVNFRGGRSKRVPLSHLIRFDGTPQEEYTYSDIPF